MSAANWVPANCYPHGHDASALCASWASYGASMLSARWAFIQIIVSAGGLMGLIYSLYLTRLALAEARKALDLARENAMIQLRSYFDIRSVQLEQQNRTRRLSFELANVGETPATEVHVSCTLEINQEASKINIEVAQVAATIDSLSGNSIHLVSFPIVETTPDLQSPLGQGDRLIAKTSVSGIDIYGKKQFRSYLWMAQTIGADFIFSRADISVDPSAYHARMTA